MKNTIVQNKIIVIDDMQAIYKDFVKILGVNDTNTELDDFESDLFGDDSQSPDDAATPVNYKLDWASQGQEGRDMVHEAKKNCEPYALAFVDMRMPPGWDGLKTIQEIWKVDESIQVVICTAYADQPWDEIMSTLGGNDRFLILKKPFDAIEVTQLARTLCNKWRAEEAVKNQIINLDSIVRQRTHDLEESNERLVQEMAHREQIETELRLAQKLEAVGQLAAGIAHEINTPIQFVSDSAHFLNDAWTDISGLVHSYRNALSQLSEESEHSAMLEELRQQEEQADFEFLAENTPQACQRVLNGIDRVATIVRAMKGFSHPDQNQKIEADINRLITDTLEVAKNEYKYIADVECDFANIPPVICYGGEIGQVLLNLIVNAAHAIEDAKSEGRGKIGVSTKSDDDGVIIKVSDTGTGIPEDIQHRIFDQFFTTKPVGKGTGQGLSMVHRIVTKHGGTIRFETGANQGTTFIIRLPVQNTSEQAKAA